MRAGQIVAAIFINLVFTPFIGIPYILYCRKVNRVEREREKKRRLHEQWGFILDA
jgi:hypothetical protein